MPWHEHHARAHNDYHNHRKHESHISHELMAGAASFAAAKAYEEYRLRHGKPVSHARAKELVAAFAGAWIDKEFETHGLDFIDRERVKHEAVRHAHDGLARSGDY